MGEKSTSDVPEWRELINQMKILLIESSPVAMIVLASAMLEDQVARTIEKMMPGGPCGELEHSMRLAILYRMGLISNNVYNALRAYASIRNKFAHEPHRHTFDSQVVTDHAKNITRALKSESEDAWTRFMGLASTATNYGAGASWEHSVAQTLHAAFVMLNFCLIWTRHDAPTPRFPKPFDVLSEGFRRPLAR